MSSLQPVLLDPHTDYNIHNPELFSKAIMQGRRFGNKFLNSSTDKADIFIQNSINYVHHF